MDVAIKETNVTQSVTDENGSEMDFFYFLCKMPEVVLKIFVNNLYVRDYVNLKKAFIGSEVLEKLPTTTHKSLIFCTNSKDFSSQVPKGDVARFVPLLKEFKFCKEKYIINLNEFPYHCSTIHCIFPNVTTLKLVLSEKPDSITFLYHYSKQLVALQIVLCCQDGTDTTSEYFIKHFFNAMNKWSFPKLKHFTLRFEKLSDIENWKNWGKTQFDLLKQVEECYLQVPIALLNAQFKTLQSNANLAKVGFVVDSRNPRLLDALESCIHAFPTSFAAKIVHMYFGKSKPSFDDVIDNERFYLHDLGKFISLIYWKFNASDTEVYAKTLLTIKALASLQHLDIALSYTADCNLILQPNFTLARFPSVTSLALRITNSLNFFERTSQEVDETVPFNHFILENLCLAAQFPSLRSLSIHLEGSCDTCRNWWSNTETCLRATLQPLRRLNYLEKLKVNADWNIVDFGVVEEILTNAKAKRNLIQNGAEN